MPTNRNIERVHTIQKNLKSHLNDNFELLVFSPNDPGPGVRWVQEITPSKGGCLGQNVLSNMAEGDLICMLTDDIVFDGSFEKALEDISNDQENYFYSVEHGTKKFTRAEFNNSYAAREDYSIFLQAFPFCNPQTKKLLLPMVYRKDLHEKLGGMINNVGLYQHYVDSWIGVWAFWNKVRCKVVKDLHVLPSAPETVFTSSKRDCLYYQFLCTVMSTGTPYQMLHIKMFDEFVERYKNYVGDDVIDKIRSYCVDIPMRYEKKIL
jgi:hypothetical protein